MVIIGIDIGGSTTKLVGLENEKVIGFLKIRANDPVSSLFGAFGRFTYENNIALNNVEKIVITGVGSSYIKEPIYGIPTNKVEEFYANGLGGLFLSGVDSALVVSMGTGTALVTARKNGGIKHIGGTAIGGGTIVGLSKKILNINDIENTLDLASTGDLTHVDLTVGHITKDFIGLPLETTASNFGRVSDMASNADIAAGIINMVLQSILTSAIFAIHSTNIKNIVLIGNISSFPQCKELIPSMNKLCDASIIIPSNSVFGTAIGASLSTEFRSI
ncbi:MAG: type II pantothenate kinase [Lachnospirales bacterium]